MEIGYNMEKKQYKKVIEHSNFDYKNATYKECREHTNSVLSTAWVLSTSETGWSFGIYDKTLFVIGAKVFCKSVLRTDVANRNNRAIGNPANLDTRELLFIFESLKLDWILYLVREKFNVHSMRQYICKPKIFDSIIKGKITSEKGLWKALISQFKVGKHIKSWKVFRDFCLHRNRMTIDTASIYDICDFTTNPELMMKELITISYGTLFEHGENELMALYSDTFRMLINEGRKFNPKWSYKRISEEHDKLVIEDMKKHAGDKSDECLYNPKLLSNIQDRNVKIVTSEREVYLKATTYNNCSYSAYFGQVVNGKYILAIIKLGEEEAMLGIRVYEDTVVFDQCYRKFNTATSQVMRDYAMHFINVNKKELAALAKKVNKKAHNHSVQTDLPFLP